MSKIIRSKNMSNRFYRVAYRIAKPCVYIFRPFKVVGKDNLPNGASLICANHSAMIDPFLIAFASGIDMSIHVFAKIELFRVPVVSKVLWNLGMIPVDRTINDISSIKAAMNYLKKGKRVVIFPEGTRTSGFDANSVKNGAVKLAERMDVPIIPVYIPRNKPFFRKSTLIFGEPYLIEKQEQKRTTTDYTKLSEALMNKIEALGIVNS